MSNSNKRAAAGGRSAYLLLPVFAAGLVQPVWAQQASHAAPIPFEGWKERWTWAAKTSAAPERFAGVAISSAYSTGLNQPPEFGPTWAGYGKRVGVRLATGSLTTFMEAGAGGLWHEDPRYYRLGPQKGFKSRVGRVLAMSVMTRSVDGDLVPAYGRWIAIPSANVISNQWRPASERTAGRTLSRIPLAFSSQAISNAFTEFWPDIKRLVFRR